MNKLANPVANQESGNGTSEVVELPRRAGAPKGRAKPKGSGRAKGTPNRRTIEVEKAFSPIAKRMAKKLEKRVEEELAKGDACNLDFCQKFFTTAAAYAYGKPRERRELTGADGGPIEQQTQIFETAERVVTAFAEVADKDDPAEALDDQSLGAVQAINFITAQREAAERKNGVPAHIPALVEERAPEATSPAQESVEEGEEPAGDPEPPDVGCTIAFLEHELRILACPPDRPNLPPVYELRGRGGLLHRGPFDVVLEKARKQLGSNLGSWVLQKPGLLNQFSLARANRSNR
jgi:hypothetical protein